MYHNVHIGIVTGIQGGMIPRLGITSPTVYNDGTDEMYLRYFKLFEPKELKNKVLLNKQICRPEKYAFSIKKGYCDNIKSLISNKDKIIQFIDQYALNNDIQVRYIMQTTALYARFIGLLNHIVAERKGDILSDIKKERKTTILDQEKPFEDFIIECEMIDLCNGVIPYFYRKYSNRNLYHSSGTFENFFETSLKQQIIDHINYISLETIEDDCKFIDRALQSTAGINNFNDFQKKFNFAVYDYENQSEQFENP